MSKLVYIAIVSLLISIAHCSNVCPLFKCEKQEPKQTCINKSVVKTDLIAYINKCKDNQFCNWNEDDLFDNLEYQASCKEIILDKGYPGDECNTIEDCKVIEYKSSFSRSCTNGICRGFSENNPCDSSKQCDIGLTCSNKTCSKFIQPGEKCTGLKDEACNGLASCYKDICTEWYTLEEGTQIAGKEFYKLCESGNAYEVSKDVWKCGRLVYKTPTDKSVIPCTSDADCPQFVGKVQNIEVEVKRQATCPCGYREDASRFCEFEQAGDSYSKLKKSYELARESFKDCPKRKKNGCKNIHAYRAKAMSAAVEFYKSPDCILDVLDAKYIVVSVLMFIGIFL